MALHAPVALPIKGGCGYLWFWLMAFGMTRTVYCCVPVLCIPANKQHLPVLHDMRVFAGVGFACAASTEAARCQQHLCVCAPACRAVCCALCCACYMQHHTSNGTALMLALLPWLVACLRVVFRSSG